MKGQVVILLLVSVFAVVFAYPKGAPSSERVCKTMNAGHGPGPQTSRAPYSITAPTKVRGGQSTTITVRGNDGEEFKGLYCQARDQGDTPVGTFLAGEDYKSGDCGNTKDNSATHIDNDEKEYVTMNWQAPEGFQGKINVVCTVLKDFDTFWTFVKPANSITVSSEQNYGIDRMFIGSIKTPFFSRKRRGESIITNRKSKILNYNPYAPFPPFLRDEDYYPIEFVQNFQDPYPDVEPDNFINDEPSFQVAQEKPPPLFKNVNPSVRINSVYTSSKEKFHEDDFNENIPHYYNPNAYKTARPAILEKPHDHLFSKEIPNTPEMISGFVPNQFPMKEPKNPFFYPPKVEQPILHNQQYSGTPTINNVQIHSHKPLEIHPFSQYGGLQGPWIGRHEFSIGPNAAIAVPPEFSYKNGNLDKFHIPKFGLLVYNPGRGSPHYLIPVSPGTKITKQLPRTHSNKDLQSSRSISEPQIIYGERFTGRNYFFGRKT